MNTTTLDLFIRLAVAALGGLAVGIEREWSRSRDPEHPRFGGVRTFLLLAVFGALAAELSRAGETVPAVVLLGGGVALVIVAYAGNAFRGHVDATTDVAGLVTLAAGTLAGFGELAVSSAVFAATALVLVEKSQLHSFVGRIEDAELRAGAQFAVLALVILPILPKGPYGPGAGVSPQRLWALVLLFSALSFVGYVALRTVGARRGYGAAGLLGGLVSSTAVTFAFARESRAHPEAASPLAVGAVAASSMLFLRVAGVATGLAFGVGRRIVRAFVVPVAAGALASVRALRQRGAPSEAPPATRNPLALRAALGMAIAFQLVLWLTAWAERQAGSTGVLGTGAIFGLVDLDALTFSMTQLAGAGGLDPRVAAEALAVGCLSNTVFKLGVAVAFGRAAFRREVALGLVAQAAGVLIAWAWIARL